MLFTYQFLLPVLLLGLLKATDQSEVGISRLLTANSSSQQHRRLQLCAYQQYRRAIISYNNVWLGPASEYTIFQVKCQHPFDNNICILTTTWPPNSFYTIHKYSIGRIERSLIMRPQLLGGRRGQSIWGLIWLVKYNLLTFSQIYIKFK